jgi:hypothetical protein
VNDDYDFERLRELRAMDIPLTEEQEDWLVAYVIGLRRAASLSSIALDAVAVSFHGTDDIRRCDGERCVKIVAAQDALDAARIGGAR